MASESGHNAPDAQRVKFLSLEFRPWAVLACFGVIAAILTVLGFAGSLWWPLDLASHFRVQYLVGFVVLAVLFAAARKWRNAALCTVFALVNVSTVAPLYFGCPPPSSSGPEYRILLFNVHTANNGYEALKRLIAESDPDFVVLEEVDNKWIAVLDCLKDRFPHAVLQPRTDNFGIALFSKQPFHHSAVEYLGKADVPSIWAEFQSDDCTFAILGTHPLPPVSAKYARLHLEQLHALTGFLQAHRLPTLVLGDLNTTPWSSRMRRFLRATGLRDSSRGRGPQPTWPANAFYLGIPIDHALYSDGIEILEKSIGPKTGSDHLPVLIDFAVRKLE